MSNHSDEYMHCYFHDVSINIRRKRGEKYEKIMYHRHGVWRFANENKAVFIWLSFIFSNSICIVIFSSFPDLQILSHCCRGGSGGNGVWGGIPDPLKTEASKMQFNSCLGLKNWF